MRFHFAVGPEYFMEIAKFRAFRFLWAKVVNAYGLNNADNAATHVHASSSFWNKTVYDPYVNMLRTTTESMSALIAGVDSLTVLPFDATYNTPDDFSERFARNQQLILKEESHFDKVADPAAGSYYVENLTNELIHYAWDLFLETDVQGGYFESFKNGLIQNRIKTEAAGKDRNIALRKHAILGVNQYPNITERLKQLSAQSVLFPEKINEEKAYTEPLTLYRGAMAFEHLRYQTDRYADNNPRPKVWMFTYGNLAMRRARSQFAGNFFGVAGYEIIDNPGFESVAGGIAAARKAKPDVVVLCASDEDFSQWLKRHLLL
jgi:methylmalonyl-CoA mutase